MGNGDRERLATAIRDRRTELGLSVSAAARAAGIHRATWTGLESGTRETEDYLYGPVERALRWSPGSIRAILDGGEPEAARSQPLDMDLAYEIRRVLALRVDSQTKLAVIEKVLDLYENGPDERPAVSGRGPTR